MLINREVLVRAVVTEEFKGGLASRLRESLDKIDASLQQLDREGAQYLEQLKVKDPEQAEEFGRKLRRQKKRQETVRAKLSDELAQVESLRIGSEYAQGRLQGFVEINLGDNLPESLKPMEVVVKDGTVVEIRRG